MERATRRQLMAELRAMNLEFDEEATAVQLRTIYETYVNQAEQVGGLPQQQQADGVPQQQGVDAAQQQQANVQQTQQDDLPVNSEQPTGVQMQQQVNVPESQSLRAIEVEQQPQMQMNVPMQQQQQIQQESETVQQQQQIQQANETVRQQQQIQQVIETEQQQQQVQQQPGTVVQQLAPHWHHGRVQQQQSAVTVQPQTAANTTRSQGYEAVWSQLNEEEARVDRLLLIERKKQELRALQAEVGGGEARNIDLGTLEAMVTKFEGADHQDITKWLRDLEHAFDIFQYSGRNRLVAARHLISGYAKQYIEMTSVQTFAELKTALLEEFRRTFTLQDVFKLLQARKLKATETPRQYVLDMQHIASRAEVPESDLVDFIIEGINDKTPVGAILYGATSLRELKLLVERYEKRRAATAQSSSSASGPRRNAVVPPIPPSKSEDLTSIRCYNCFKYGHYQSACQMPKRPQNACFVCNQVGHTRHQCPQRSRRNAAAVVSAAIAEMDSDELAGLAEQLASKNLVSIAFFKNNECFGNVVLSALFDSGSPISFVSHSCVPFKIPTDGSPTRFRGVGNKRLITYGRVECKVKFKQQEIYHQFYVLPDADAVVPVLIGRDLLKKFNIFLFKIKTNEITYNQNELLSIDRKSNKAELSKNVTKRLDSFKLSKHSLRQVPTNDGSESKIINVISGDSRSCQYEQAEVADEIDIGNQLSEVEKKKILEIIKQEYIGKVNKENKTNVCSMKIRLTDNTPVYSGPRKLSVKEKMEIQKTIDELSDRKIVRPSESPYASPIVPVRKKNGNLRMCVDYRAVNKLIVRDRYPLPLMDDCLALMGGKKLYSLLDLKDGFHQVPVEEESKHITSFVTPMGQYEYNFVPFGIVNAPSVFQRFITRVLQPVIAKGKVVVYLDDIGIATETLQEHFEILSEVLTILAEAGLELNLVIV